MPKVKKLIKKIKNWHNRKSTKASRHFTSTKAAQILFDVIREYKPPVYDVFGYDFSGRRRRLIESFVEDPHDKAVDKYYGEELFEVKRCRRKGRLLQELKFGLLVNKIFDDLKLNADSKKLKKQVHWSVLKIAKASKHEYKNYKKTHPLHKPCRMSASGKFQIA
jgi:hypothetical protein